MDSHQLQLEMSLRSKRCSWVWLGMATHTCWAFVLLVWDLGVAPHDEFSSARIQTVVCCLLLAWVVPRPPCGSGVAFQEANCILLTVCLHCRWTC